jgi:hypothetical protein
MTAHKDTLVKGDKVIERGNNGWWLGGLDDFVGDGITVRRAWISATSPSFRNVVDETQSNRLARKSKRVQVNGVKAPWLWLADRF